MSAIPEHIVKSMLESIGLHHDRPIWLTLVDAVGIELDGMQRKQTQPLFNSKGWGGTTLEVPEIVCPHHPDARMRRVWVAIAGSPDGDIMIDSVGSLTYFDVPDGGTIEVSDINLGFSLGLDVRRNHV